MKLTLSALMLGALFPASTPAQLPPVTTLREVRVHGDGSLDAIVFEFVPDVVLSRSGQLVVLDRRARVAHQFDASGRVQRTVGRAGNGPGEFTTPTRLGLSGDSLWVVDIAARRLTLFTPNGRYVRELVGSDRVLKANAHPEAAGPGGSAFISVLEVTPRAGATAGDRTGATNKVTLFRTDSGFALTPIYSFTRRYGRVRAPIVVQGKDGWVNVPQPFEDDPIWDATTGSLAVLERASETGRVQVHKIGHDGKVLYVASVPVRAVRLDRNTFEVALRRAATFEFDGKESHADISKVRAAFKRPAYIPAADQVVAATDGTVWVRLTEGGGGTQYLVLDERGRVRSRIRLPAGEEVLDAYGRRAAVRRVTNDGEVYVVMYEAPAR